MKQIIDGCTAATHVAFALSDVATIYPITPIASMGETAQRWGLVEGRTNLFGQPLDVQEMESELGAAGATHGALTAGALATTFTSSQGLLLMIPNMMKIAGEQLPAVFHVGTRSVATHALSIFGDHSDVMACRSTGFAMLASASVQETMDLALVAHLAAIDGSLPVLHFFDGWRTSNQMSTIDVIPYEQMRPLVSWQKVEAFRQGALNPEHPEMRGTSQSPAVFFQNREACNTLYDAFPDVVQAAMQRVGDAIGRHYNLVDYYGAPDAESVMVIMGSGVQVAREAVAWMNARGAKVGVVAVRLFLPFPVKAFVDAIPARVRYMAVMDRTKEPGAVGEPLYLQAVAALDAMERRGIRVTNGRYGLSSKDFTPSMVKTVLERTDAPRTFTIGINDDVTHLSLPVTEHIDTTPAGMYQATFYGMGSDGTVGSTKLAANILGNADNLYAQAYFNYSAKKSGGYTISQLRLAHAPITADYAIEHADYIGCNKDTYTARFPDMLATLKSGGIFVLNSAWTDADTLARNLPAHVQALIRERGIRLYNIDAAAVAAQTGLGVRINTVMMTVFLRLSALIPFEQARAAFEQQVKAEYAHEGSDIVERNLAAIDAALGALKQITLPAQSPTPAEAADEPLPPFIARVQHPCFELLGDTLPVSAFNPRGTLPPGTAAYERRCIALEVPVWDADKCVTCCECSLVCSHAAIRPALLTADERKAAPAEMVSKPLRGPLCEYQFRIQVDPANCTGCASCATICPGHALTMVPMLPQLKEQQPYVDYIARNIPYKGGAINRFTVNGSQFYQPLMEYSGACGGCGETPYVKLLTQLFGERMLIANATGCSSIWGGSYPANPYCTNAEGRGPAWANSLFEDNAEYAYGMACAVTQRRERLRQAAQTLPQAAAWLKAYDDPEASQSEGEALLHAIADIDTPEALLLRAEADMLGKKSIWAVGGDGWAYDIGFAGLDHVLASGVDINILVLDTECYSNTGGQMSKATPLSACAKYAPLGKRTPKKDLGRMMMTYGNVYVAQIALGASYMQAIDALRAAESYPGPSLVIAYCPCIEHGIRTGMSHTIVEERDAVAAGYWQIYRYDPRQSKPLTVDEAAPTGSFVPYLTNENRYIDLKMRAPADYAVLWGDLRKHALGIYTDLENTLKTQ